MVDQSHFLRLFLLLVVLGLRFLVVFSNLLSPLVSPFLLSLLLVRLVPVEVVSVLLNVRALFGGTVVVVQVLGLAVLELGVGDILF